MTQFLKGSHDDLVGVSVGGDIGLAQIGLDIFVFLHQLQVDQNFLLREQIKELKIISR
jgi:hypothetical protein